MLSKLMKYELKATSRLLIPLYLILLFISIINRFVLAPNSYAEQIRVIDQFLLITYVSTIFVVFVVTFLYMIIRFYKNLLTDEGYLMFTLPTKTHQLITSKLLITLFWSLLSIIAVLFSLFIVFANSVTIPDAINAAKEAIAALNGQFGVSWILVFTEMLIASLLGLVANILLIYVSIAIGQLFSKHKIIGSFGAYMLIYLAVQLLITIIFIPFGIFISNNPTTVPPIPQVILPVTIVILAAGCVVFYFATNYIFKRKLNLD